MVSVNVYLFSLKFEMYITAQNKSAFVLLSGWPQRQRKATQASGKTLYIFLGADTVNSLASVRIWDLTEIHWLQNHHNSVPWLFHNIPISTPYFLSLCSRWCQRQFARLLPSRKIWFSLISFMNWLSRDKMKTKRILWLDFPVGEHTVIKLFQPVI